MALDEFNLEEGSTSGSVESPSEQSEKQREASRRAQAQLQKTQKDEKKAKTDDDELFIILSRFIKDPTFNDLIPDITNLLQYNYPSRFLLVVIALIYTEASYYLLSKTGKTHESNLLLTLYHYPKAVEFHNDTIHPSLRDWITAWLTSSEYFLISPDTSVILTQKLSTLLTHSEKGVAYMSLARVFQFFFIQKNVSMSFEKAQAYSDFILSQMRTSLEAALLHMDNDLREKKELSEKDLFGI